MCFKKTNNRRRKIAAGIASSIALMIAADISAEQGLWQLDIKSGEAGKVLLELAEDTGVQFVVPQNIDKTVQLPAIVGAYTLSDALDLILKNSGLNYEFTSQDSVVITNDDEKTEEGSEKEQTGVDEEVVVTGSRIVTDPGKLTRQMKIISREELDASGITRLDEYLRRLPQNVNAPTNVASGTFEDGVNFGRGQNVFAGSGVNLRGLGEQYTLILIDGRRPAKGGLFGDVVDISTIPIEQVERIEILYDGAAALYGADAIGGVINIITDREFEGTRVSASITETEDGGGEEFQLNIGHTFTWGNATLTANLNYQERKPLDGSERSIQFTPLPAGGQGFALSNDEGLVLNPSSPPNIGTGFSINQTLMWVADLDGDGRTDNAALDERIAGGIVVDGPFGFPTTVQITPPPGYVPVFTLQLPEGITGDLSLYDIPEVTSVPLPAADAPIGEILDAMRARFPIGESTFQLADGFSLLPTEETVALSLSYRQDVNEDLTVHLSYRYSQTDRESSTRNDAQQLVVSGTESINPFGSNFFLNFNDNLPQTVQQADIENHSVSGGVDYHFNEDWSMQFGFAVGENTSMSDQVNAFDLFALFDAASGSTFDFVTFEFVPNGLGFHLPFFGYGSQEAYSEALITDLIKTETVAKTVDVDLSFAGVLGQLPAGDIRTNIILSRVDESTDVITEQFDDDLFGNFFPGFDRSASSNTGTVRTGVGMEISIPVLNSVLANLNGRYETYDVIDDTAFNWAAGFNWDVAEWMTVRLNRTHSVRIPESVVSGADTQLFSSTQRVYDENRQSLGNRMPIYRLVGGNPLLEPERNYGTSLGFIFRPLEGMDVQLNLNESRTVDRVSRPVVDTRYTPTELLPENVALNPLLQYTQGTEFAVNDGAEVFTETDPNGSIPGVPIAPGVLVTDEREYNVGNSFSRSADLQLRYNLSTDWGDWFINFSHQYTDAHERVFSDICVEGVCQSDDVVQPNFSDPTVIVTPANLPVDIVEGVDRIAFGATRSVQPLPKHRSSFDVSWSYRGLSINAQTVYQSATSIVESERREGLNDTGEFIFRINKNRITTKPASIVNLNVAYDFSGDLFDAPDWLNTTRINLQIGNLFYDEVEISREVLEQEFVPDPFNSATSFTPFSVEPNGRRATLRLSTSF